MAKVRERYNASEVPSDQGFRGWLRREFMSIQRAIKRLTLSIGNVASAAVVGISDHTTLTLTGNAALTLDIEGVVAGDTGVLEITQDGTGGRVPTWLNATGSAGAVTAPAAGAGAKTMYDCRYNGTKWVLSVHASNYT